MDVLWIAIAVCILRPQVFNKFLLCLPLRPGLIAWGYAQLVAVIVISWYAILHFSEEVAHMSCYSLVQAVILFIITMIVSLLEIINCIFLVLGAHKKNANFLEVCYHYLKVKVPVFTVLLIISFFLKLFVYCQNWYYYNLDPWRYLILLDNQAMGVIDIGLQFYLLLLVRSEIIKLEHPIGITSLYQRLFDKPIPADALTSKPNIVEA